MRAVPSASVTLRGSPHSQANLWSNEDKQIAKACHPGHTCQKEMMASSRSSCCFKARTFNSTSRCMQQISDLQRAQRVRVVHSEHIVGALAKLQHDSVFVTLVPQLKVLD